MPSLTNNKQKFNLFSAQIIGGADSQVTCQALEREHRNDLDQLEFQSALSEKLERDIENEDRRHTSTLKRVVSVIEKENDIQVSQFLNEDDDIKPKEHKFINLSKKMHQDDICPIGIWAQQSRVDFAYKHIFKNGYKNQEEEEIDEDGGFSSQDEDSSCYTVEDESLEEANLTDLSNNSHRENSLETNRVVNKIEDSVEMAHASASMPPSHTNGGGNTAGNDEDGAPNIDMFMACCDWETAIEAERQQISSHRAQ